MEALCIQQVSKLGVLVLNSTNMMRALTKVCSGSLPNLNNEIQMVGAGSVTALWKMVEHREMIGLRANEIT